MIAVADRGRLPYPATIDERPVCAAQITNKQVLAHAQDLGVPSGNPNRADLQVYARPPTNHERIVVDHDRRQCSRRRQTTVRHQPVSTRLAFPLTGRRMVERAMVRLSRVWMDGEANEPYVKFSIS